MVAVVVAVVVAVGVCRVPRHLAVRSVRVGRVSRHIAVQQPLSLFLLFCLLSIVVDATLEVCMSAWGPADTRMRASPYTLWGVSGPYRYAILGQIMVVTTIMYYYYDY